MDPRDRVLTGECVLTGSCIRHDEDQLPNMLFTPSQYNGSVELQFSLFLVDKHLKLIC